MMCIYKKWSKGRVDKFIACIVIGNLFELRWKIQVDGAAFVVYHHVRSPSIKFGLVPPQRKPEDPNIMISDARES